MLETTNQPQMAMFKVCSKTSDVTKGTRKGIASREAKRQTPELLVQSAIQCLCFGGTCRERTTLRKGT